MSDHCLSLRRNSARVQKAYRGPGAQFVELDVQATDINEGFGAIRTNRSGISLEDGCKQ
jgi:hypothetical protein